MRMRTMTTTRTRTRTRMRMMRMMRMRMWPGLLIRTCGLDHPKPSATHVTFRFFQQSCAKDSEMLILGKFSLINRW